MDKTIRMSGSCEGTVHLKRMSRDEDYIRDACRQTEAYSKEALRARLGEGILFTGTWAGATDCQELDEEELLEGELSASGETALDSQAALLVLARPAGSLAMVQIHARQQRGRMQHGRLWTQRCSSQGAMKGEQMDRKMMKKLLYRIKPPCPECPYTLGLVHTFANPCPTCRINGYRTFERFQRFGRGLPERPDDAGD